MLSDIFLLLLPFYDGLQSNDHLLGSYDSRKRIVNYSTHNSIQHPKYTSEQMYDTDDPGKIYQSIQATQKTHD